MNCCVFVTASLENYCSDLAHSFCITMKIVRMRFIRKEKLEKLLEMLENQRRRQNKCAINEIFPNYGIPFITLKRRFVKQDIKQLTLG